MKLLLRILAVIAFVFIMLFCAASIYWSIEGSNVIASQLQDITGRKVTIGYYAVNPPLTLIIKNLEIKGLAKVESMSISPSFLSLVTSGFILREVILTRPQITFEKAISKVESKEASSAPAISIPTGEYVRSVKQKKKILARFGIQNFTVKNGRFEFIDSGVSGEGIKLVLKDITFRADNLYIFPFSLVSDFDFKAKIPWEKGVQEGKVEAVGWVNLTKRSMEANIKMEDIDGLYFYPYYAQWVNLERSGIEKATLNLSSNIHGLDNIATVSFKIELKDIAFKSRAPDEGEHKEEKIAHAVIDIFKALASNNTIVFEHTFQTKMDMFEFGIGQFKTALEDRVMQGMRKGGGAGEILLLPARLLTGFFKGATDLTAAVVVGTLGAGIEVGRAIGSSFKKQHK